MPSRANANTVFFCASVVSTCALSPAVCAAVKSPRRLELTLRSTSVCRGLLRSTATTRTSAFPYWLGPSTIAMPRTVARGTSRRGACRSAAAVRRIRERGQQQRHVVVLARLVDDEGQHDLGVEGVPPLLG